MKHYKKSGLKDTIKSAYSAAVRFVYRWRTVLVASYLTTSIILFFFQFNLLTNWDMLVRILNANYLFHGGYYFEPARAVLESFLIGVFSFFMGNYAVYGFMALSTVVFFLSAWRLSAAFGLDSLLFLTVLMNPYVLLYGMSNGSELLILAFLMLYVAAIKTKSYLAGLFFGLAFMSKYYAVYFLPLMVFLVERDVIQSIKRLGINLLTLFAVLLPYFVFNLVYFGNLLYGLALSYLNNGIEAGSPQFLSAGFIELAVPAVILAGALLFRRKLVLPRLRPALILSVAFAASIYLYYASGALSIPASNAYRFFLPAMLFSLISVSMFLEKKTVVWLIVLPLVSFPIAFLAVSSQAQTAPLPGYFSNAVSDFASVYNTTNCTVYSNDWVELDYYGLPAVAGPRYEPTVYNGTPIVSFGEANTTYPLRFRAGNLYIYGGAYCRFYKVQSSFISSENAYLAYTNQTLIPEDPCFWLFGMSPKLQWADSSCDYVNGAAAAILR